MLSLSEFLFVCTFKSCKNEVPKPCLHWIRMLLQQNIFWLNLVCAFRVSETLFHYECWFQLQAVGLTTVRFTYSFAKDGGKQLQQNMEENKTITHIDLRLTECGTEAEYCIYQILHKNRERERELNIRKQKQT